MADHPKTEIESGSATPKYSTPKDKSCPFCGQTFTSSSLGRHLDLYIRERNPKAPDGVHNVDEIRRMRSGITRRLPRGSTGPKKDLPDSPTSASTSVAATPVATPHAGGGAASIGSGRDGDGIADSSTATPGIGIGIMNYTPQSRPEGQHVGEVTRKRAGSPSAASQSSMGPPAGSKQVLQKSQLELRGKLAEAQDRAYASELALREVLSSWRAAKQHVDNNSMPFESSPLSLDFPALVLRFLQPPPTLFSSIQTPTPTSWFIKAPAEAECRALNKFFNEEFSRWKDGCMRATRAAFEDLPQPLGGAEDRTAEMNEAIGRARDQADAMEAQVQEHVHAAFTTWARLHQNRRDELWVLELARDVSKSRQELERHKDERHRLAQENANLKTHIEHLNRLQQPKEYRILAPATLPFERDVVNHVLSEGIMGGRGSNTLGEDRHMDLNTAVRKSIERWKTVVTTTRATSSGMSSQKPLGQAEHVAQSDVANGCPTPSRPHAQPSALLDRQAVAANMSNNVPSEPQTAPPSISGGASTIDDHSDDEAVSGAARNHNANTNDADQEMEGNETYAAVHTSRPVSIPSIKQAIDGSVASHGLGSVDMAAPRGHPMQLQGQMQAGVAVMHEGMSTSSHMQRGGDMTIMMEQARFMMQQQANQKAHMDNLARTMPGLSTMQTSLHHHQPGALELDIQNSGMYME